MLSGIMSRLATIIFLFGILHLSDAALQWSDSYILKAILTIPSANISEPYQIWYDGVSRKSRVDFYNGLDKLYKIYDEIQGKYRYFKIHPESTKQGDVTEVCSEIMVKTQYENDYLPVKDFKFIGIEDLGDIKTHKYEAKKLVIDDNKVEATYIYSMWVTFEGSGTLGSTPVPVKYRFQLITQEGKVLDYIQHDYSYYEPVRPDPMILSRPLDMQCNFLRILSLHETVDPLVELVDPVYEHPRVREAFKEFKTKHNKNYTNEEEHFKRLNNFKANLRSINSINRRHIASVTVNQFADLSNEEKRAFLSSSFVAKNRKVTKKKNHDGVKKVGLIPPTDFDWRDYDAVTPVKHQSFQCQACYAFVTAAAVESSAFITGGCKRMRGVSEQAIIDCTWRFNTSYGNLGCRGGTIDYSLFWIETNGAPLRDEYGRYLAMEGVCHNKNMTQFLNIKGYLDVDGDDYSMKKELITHGPLLISVHNELDSFYFYDGTKVYNDPECKSLPATHGLTIVGYGFEEGTGLEYWIVKNSWGESWGQEGYMRIAMRNNICGVRNYVQSVYFRKNKYKLCKPKKTKN